jgi:hypothetical protein
MKDYVAVFCIYYSREKWHHFITKSIIQVFQEFSLSCEKNDINGMLSFGEKDKCIQLTIYGISEKLGEVCSNVKEILETYIRNNPSGISMSQKFIPGDVLWMPAENNAVAIEFLPSEFFFRYPEQILFRQSITNILLDWFCDDDNISFGNEDAFSIAIYLQLVLLNLIVKNKNLIDMGKVFAIIEASMDISNLENNKDLNDASKEGYDVNEQMIDESFRSILPDCAQNSRLKELYDLMESILNKPRNEDAINPNLVVQTMASIYAQLGIVDLKQLFIHKMLRKYYYNHFEQH